MKNDLLSKLGVVKALGVKTAQISGGILHAENTLSKLIIPVDEALECKFEIKALCEALKGKKEYSLVQEEGRLTISDGSLQSAIAITEPSKVEIDTFVTDRDHCPGFGQRFSEACAVLAPIVPTEKCSRKFVNYVCWEGVSLYATDTFTAARINVEFGPDEEASAYLLDPAACKVVAHADPFDHFAIKDEGLPLCELEFRFPWGTLQTSVSGHGPLKLNDLFRAETSPLPNTLHAALTKVAPKCRKTITIGPSSVGTESASIRLNHVHPLPDHPITYWSNHLKRVLPHVTGMHCGEKLLKLEGEGFECVMSVWKGVESEP